jgi:hypothetical protein
MQRCSRDRGDAGSRQRARRAQLCGELPCGAMRPSTARRWGVAFARRGSGGIEASLAGGDFSDVILSAGIGAAFGAICPPAAIGGLAGGGIAWLGAYALGGDPNTRATAYQWGSLVGGLAGDFTGGALTAGKFLSMRALRAGVTHVGPDLLGAGVGAIIGYSLDGTSTSALHGANLGMMAGGIAGGTSRRLGSWAARRGSTRRHNLLRERAFFSNSDPARRVLGPARFSHADEIADMRRVMEAEGIEIISRPGVMAYSPTPRMGRPGQFLIDPDASYSAWLHEFRHFLDDRMSKWQGSAALYHKTTRWLWEQRAFAEEIRLMRRLGYKDVVEELVKLRTIEWRKIFMPHLEM